MQKAAITALTLDESAYIEKVRATYQRRRDVFVEGMNALGWKIKKPLGSMYVWLPVPNGYDSTEFSYKVAEKTGVVFSPGVAFGDLGEGFVRAGLVVNEDRIIEALKRLEKAGIKYNG